MTNKINTILLLLLALFITCSLCINLQPSPSPTSTSEPTQRCIFKTDDGKTINLSPLQNIDYTHFDEYSLSEYYFSICSVNSYCQELLDTTSDIQSCALYEENGTNVTTSIGLISGATSQINTEVTNLFYYQNVGLKTCPGTGHLIIQFEMNCNYYTNYTFEQVYYPRTCHTILSISSTHACIVGSSASSDDEIVNIDIK